jgi:putative aldouronate transport system substrate-binding protein
VARTDRDASFSTTRRGFIRFAAAAGTAGVPFILSACAPSSPSAAGSGAAPASATARASSASGASTPPAATNAGASAKPSGGPYPTYIPVANAPKPDYANDDPRYDPGFDNYPANPFKAIQSAPGSGGLVNTLIAAYYPLPTIYEQNQTWQEINKQLNANVQMNIIAGADYRTKLATVMASDDLPDIIHLYQGWSAGQNLPTFLKAKCADLTPYLGGDAAKDYPYLAAIPTYAWKNSISAIDGQLFLVPIHRQLPTYPGAGGGYFFANSDIWDKEIGADVNPKNADDFKRILVQLNRPQSNRWAIGNSGGATGVPDFLFGLQTYAAAFGAPNVWKLDSSGKLIRDRETEEYKAAVGYLRDLMAAGVFPSDVSALANSRNDLVAGKFVLSVEGYGNGWNDFWRRGLMQNPPNHYKMLKPFAAADGGQPQAFMTGGFVAMNALKKANPDRIKELLRIMNFLAAPFGSQEDLLLSYGLKDQDYSLDARGNPVPNTEGINRAGYVPWRYIAQHPYLNYQADLPGFAKASWEALQFLIPLSVNDPTQGYYSPTNFGKGAAVNVTWSDGVRDIILGRRPLSDYDGITKDWVSNAGDQIRKEFSDAMKA